MRDLIPPLGMRAWRLLLGNTLSQVGTGLTYPFLIVYLYQIRHFDLTTASLVVATSSLCGLLTIFVGGWVDRFGSGRILILCLILSALGTGGFVFVRHPLEAFVVASFYGFGTYGMWNALSSLYVKVVSPEYQGTIFGVNYALQNVGLGLGALIGGLVLNVHVEQSFEQLFFFDAVSFLLFAAILVGVGEIRRWNAETAQAHSLHVSEEKQPRKFRRGYRAALADRTLLAATALNMFLVIIALSQLNTAFPVWVTGPIHASTSLVGLAIAANTLTIILAQLFMLKILRGRRRTRATALAAGFFGLAWLLTVAAGFYTGPGAFGGFVLALVIFGLGETLLSPSLSGIINAVAPETLRGRYNAIFNFSWQGGTILGPILSGFMLGRGWGSGLFLLLALGCGLAILLSLALERILPSGANNNQVLPVLIEKDKTENALSEQ